MSSQAITTTTTPRIAIIGGGLGGLTLLLTLAHRGVPATLYERDASVAARAHLGGVLDLGWTSGQRALRENGLQDAFMKHSRPEGEEMKMYDASGKLHLHHGLDESGPQQKPEHIRPEIDRTILRQILLDACPANAIKWDHALTSAVPLEDGKHELTFANGFKTVCDFLVGADGANSRIRPLVSPVTPFYSGVNGVEISLAPAVASSPELKDVVDAIGQGTMFALQDAKMLGSQVNGDGRIRTYVFFRGPAEWTVPSSPADARKVLLEKFEGWAPWMLKLIEFCDDAAIYPRPLYMLPVGHKWEHVLGVTILGDAAHQMSPFSGAGANLAMQDALELGLALAKLFAEGKAGDRVALEVIVKEFEVEMCERAARVADMSKTNLDAFVNPGAPQTAIDRFAAFGEMEEREG
ncbi:FAD/NAD(P)-binding domain-containing protein [Lentinus tigrinus ALCF2SS1-7]|uniref:FAD/NAD(P)-binding domain-containing protein n=1 Tax=Lentinus tigrinus ALCF2SS1-6 TaxID=1328759 RepID=A0A5C2S1F7_9APHY|nr:FAD/NAD(P)-binding domain-containing protein [Lentinus tigrinus ALCF2SS1-6]RPD73105.1 FAD/NAD(P)-binding domain-containing protein [Lentinus tigrinus ALCF2SS1-7]